MALLCVPNWSIGRERTVVRQVRDLLESAPVALHFCAADIDHNRTVTAFSGTPENVQKTLLDLSRLILPAVNLQRHQGVHPRIGGLDVCPFVPLPDPQTPEDTQALQQHIEETAQTLAAEFEIPVFLYEKSEKGRHSSQLPTLRKGGFGSLLSRTLEPDFGPNQAHPHLGATVIGWRPFLVALNLNYPSPKIDAAKRVAAHVRDLRQSGDPRFIGVRALGLHLPAQKKVQISLNITRPDQTPIDPIISHIESLCAAHGLRDGYPELIGVVRDTDLEHATKLPCRPGQIVPTRQSPHYRSPWPTLIQDTRPPPPD